MYARDFLRAGDYMMVVPLGIPITLEYNDSGNLVKVYRDWDTKRVDMTETLLPHLLSSTLAPLRIGLRSGTTWVEGVIYTSTNFVTENTSNRSVQDMTLSAFQSDSANFNFFAGYLDTKVTPIKGGAPVRGRLQLEGFNCLPCYWIHQSPVTAKMFDAMVDREDFPFKYPLIMNLFVYRGNDFFRIDNELNQYVIRRVMKDVDENGYIYATLLTTDKNFRVKVSFTDVVNYNLNPGSLIIIDKGGNVIYSAEVDGKHHDPRVRYTECVVCGKRIIAPTDRSAMICSNKHCRSRMLPVFNHFLNSIGLAPIPASLYWTYIKRGELLCVPDVFELPEYHGASIKMSMGALLRALVPVSEVVGSDVFTVFASKCNNSLNTMLYYIDNPQDIYDDLGFEGQPNIVQNSCRQFMQWLDDLENRSDVKALFACEQITIVESDRKFSGPAIFRNKTIMITGKFKHGDHTEIKAILRSYSAEVVYEMTPEVCGVLVGDIPDGVNGAAIRHARKNMIPVMSESEFFKEYDIDSDLKMNLV